MNGRPLLLGCTPSFSCQAASHLQCWGHQAYRLFGRSEAWGGITATFELSLLAEAPPAELLAGWGEGGVGKIFFLKVRL